MRTRLGTGNAGAPARSAPQETQFFVEPNRCAVRALRSKRARAPAFPVISSAFYLHTGFCCFFESRNHALLNGQSRGSLHNLAFTGLFSMYRTVFAKCSAFRI